MAFVDWAIVILIGLAVLGGLSKGFFRSFCSLGGLFLGLVLAAWNYAWLASLIVPLVRIEAIADTIGFLIVAIVVMCLFDYIGKTLASALHMMGLGFLDKLAGAAFGFLQGALVVTLLILVTVAFFPHAHWLTQGRLPKRFFGACHLSTHMSPAELALRVRVSLNELERESPWWLHPESGRS